MQKKSQRRIAKKIQPSSERKNSDIYLAAIYSATIHRDLEEKLLIQIYGTFINPIPKW